MTETFWIITKLVNKQYSIYHLKMFQILFICYFCFYFTFTVYTNVLNTVVFSFFQPPTLLFQPPPPSRLLVFVIFSNHPYSSTSPVYWRPQSNRNSRFQSFYMPLPLFHFPIFQLCFKFVNKWWRKMSQVIYIFNLKQFNVTGISFKRF